MFYGDHGIELEKATTWINAVIAQHPDVYYYYYQKARILAKKGDKEGAIGAATKAQELAKQDTNATSRDEYIRLTEALIASQK